MARPQQKPTSQAEVIEASLVAGLSIESGIVEAELIAKDGQQHVGVPCPSCGAPREGNTKFCVACGTPLETPDIPLVVSGESGSSANALPSHTFQCQNCGSEVATSMEQRSYVCPFCDSSYVTELPFQRGRQRPEFVIGFSITAAQAKEKYFEWLGRNAWFRPGDLAVKAIAEKQKGIYLPFWHFSMLARSEWSANIGEYWYRTETYTSRDSKGKTTTHTRQVRETEWFPLRGKYQRYLYGFLVPATQGITKEEAHAIQPFQLSALARYRPYFLAGWMSEEYSIDMQVAIEQSKEEFRKQQTAEISRFLPGDTSSGLSASTEFELSGSDLILLPVHVLSYRYGDRIFRFLVNGQTGKIIGQKPWSGKRVSAAVAIVLVIIALIVGTVIFLANQ
jgi:hypothetical protein